MKRLIVTADDLGASPAVNRAVVESHRGGILTAASLMINAPAAAEAVRLAKECPGLGVGLHLTLAVGTSTLDPKDLRGIVNARGEFDASPTRAGLKYFFRKSLREALAREVEAQLAKFRDTGLTLDHVDGHVNIHIHPVVLRILLGLAPKFGIAAMRVPQDDLAASRKHGRRRRAGASIEAATFKPLCARARKLLAAARILTSDRCYGVHESGHMTETYVTGVLRDLPDGLSEMYFHPATTNAGGTPGYEHRAEFETLTSPRVKEASEGILRTTYAEARRPEAAPSPAPTSPEPRPPFPDVRSSPRRPCGLTKGARYRVVREFENGPFRYMNGEVVVFMGEEYDTHTDCDLWYFWSESQGERKGIDGDGSKWSNPGVWKRCLEPIR